MLGVKNKATPSPQVAWSCHVVDLLVFFHLSSFQKNQKTMRVSACQWRAVSFSRGPLKAPLRSRGYLLTPLKNVWGAFPLYPKRVTSCQYFQEIVIFVKNPNPKNSATQNPPFGDHGQNKGSAIFSTCFVLNLDIYRIPLDPTGLLGRKVNGDCQRKTRSFAHRSIR